MTKRELINAIGKETNYMSVVVNEIKKLLTDLEKKEPEIIQLTALASFAAQFYNGVENILKRICHFNNVTIPKSQDWHIGLFKWFCNPPVNNLPVLFSETDSLKYSSIRKFRHYFFHGYSRTIKWEWIKEGVSDIDDMFREFNLKIDNYINSIKDD